MTHVTWPLPVLPTPTSQLPRPQRPQPPPYSEKSGYLLSPMPGASFLLDFYRDHFGALLKRHLPMKPISCAYLRLTRFHVHMALLCLTVRHKPSHSTVLVSILSIAYRLSRPAELTLRRAGIYPCFSGLYQDLKQCPAQAVLSKFYINE